MPCYQALAEGGRLPPPLPIQYADFAEWQRRRLDQTVVLDNEAGAAADEAASPAAAARTCSLVLAKVRHSLRPVG